MTPEQEFARRRRVVDEAVLDGQSISSVAKQLGMSRTTLLAWVKGNMPWIATSRSRREQPVMTPEQVTAARRAYLTGRRSPR